MGNPPKQSTFETEITTLMDMGLGEGEEEIVRDALSAAEGDLELHFLDGEPVVSFRLLARNPGMRL